MIKTNTLVPHFTQHDKVKIDTSRITDREKKFYQIAIDETLVVNSAHPLVIKDYIGYGYFTFEYPQYLFRENILKRV